MSNVEIQGLRSIDIFQIGKDNDTFIGDLFYLDYDIARVLVQDFRKQKVAGVPQGAFLLAFYENPRERDVEEAVLLRSLGPTSLPTDREMMSSMIEYYKEEGKPDIQKQDIDEFTRYEFSFSGMECRVLGTFYRDGDGKVRFGADLENFFSPHHYRVYKPAGDTLKKIVNYRDISDKYSMKLGKVRYSSSLRFANSIGDVSFYIPPEDFLGKRTALFGMTRTGKSNTVKRIIQACTENSKDVEDALPEEASLTDDPEAFNPIAETGAPKYQVGQIIFDINGEYANANMQDAGTAIFESYRESTVRFSVVDKPGFEIMKVNFHRDLVSGLSLIAQHFKEKGESSDYLNNFLGISLEKPDDYSSDMSVKRRYDRKVAAYRCCLHRAGFASDSHTLHFEGNKDINEQVKEGGIDPSKGISFDDAIAWFSWVWEHYASDKYFANYKSKKGRDWADEELQALLIFLTKKRHPGKDANVSGYTKLAPVKRLHTAKADEPFEKIILGLLRKGKIVIVDLSQGDPEVQKLYSSRICEKIFADSMDRFVNNKPNNVIQMYFEEAHNLFPRKEEKDLSLIYNRLAKEGAKLNLGIVYATQEVSSISANILKNTQNWFVAHLNNQDELKELTKYYDFTDFAATLTRFSSDLDKGFVRVKTYTNPFVVPVQIDRFVATSPATKTKK